MSKLPSLRLVMPTPRWPELAVFPLVRALYVLPLLWCGWNWPVGTDGSRYLLLTWNLISGEGYTLFGNGTQVISEQRDGEKARRTLEKIYGTAASEGS